MKKYIMKAEALASGIYYDREYDDYFNVFRETNVETEVAFKLTEDNGKGGS